jgi:hypothetical protein
MMCYADRTFCSSPHCENKCGRKMPKEVESEAIKSGLYISTAYFCGEPEKEGNDRKTKAND